MATEDVKAVQQRLEAAASAFRDLQRDTNKVEIARQQCAQQLSENDMVMKELEVLEADANVYKLVGPLLVKQDLVEARANVGKRLEFITSESERLDVQSQSLEKKMAEKQQEVLAAQSKLAAGGAAAVKAAAGAKAVTA